MVSQTKQTPVLLDFLTLTYALPIAGNLNAILNSFVHTERQMIAVERVKEYTELESEEDVVGAGSTANARDVPHPGLEQDISSLWLSQSRLLRLQSI